VKTKMTQNEVIAGSTTFITITSIIFVKPQILSSMGMDFGIFMIAPCFSSLWASARVREKTQAKI